MNSRLFHSNIAIKIAGAGVLVIVINCLSFAQSSFCGSGNTIANSTGNVSYTIGQSFILNSTGNNGYANGGIQQAFSIYTLNTEELQNEGITISAFPNPADNYFIITKTGATKSTLKYTLYNMNGIALMDGYLSEKSVISMENYLSGTYLLEILLNETQIRTLRIIKH